jgi:DNA ligase-1
MPELEEGEVAYVQGSAAKPYELTRSGDVYSCTCPAWMHQGRPIDQRTCKHLKAWRGEAAEAERVGAAGLQAAGGQARTGGDGGGRRPAQKKEGAPPVLLAHAWEHDRDLTGWWMSEKLDGMRAYWDGKRLLSRLGNEVLAPEWFLEGLPPEPLDGELWIARGQFQRTMSVVRSGGKGPRWKEVRYVLFDAPGRAEAPFEERLAWLRERFPAGAHPWAAFHDHVTCEGIEHLRAELDRVEALGGEGLMLRQPGSRYVAGRSTSLLKVKRFFDAEARVVGHQAGTGKHKGRLGALRVVLASGTEFAIGTGFSDAERQAPPPVGAVVTFRYQELSEDGVPRFGSYVGVRDDVAWPPDPASQPQRGARPPAPARAKAPPSQPLPAPRGEEQEAPPSPAPRGEEQAQPTTRRFELVSGASSKFWELTVRGAEHRVRFGKLGANGQTQLKAFPSPEAAQAAAEKLVREKQGKGYREV